MMEYEVFKEVVMGKFKDYLPEEFRDNELVQREVFKVNRKLDSLSMNMNSEGKNISPSIYINDMYEEYRASEDLDMTLRNTAEVFVKAMNQSKEIKEKLNLDDVEDKIIFQLINTEQNKEFLETVPNRPFKDLSIIYRCMMEDVPDGTCSAVVTNGLAETLGLSEEELFNRAKENTVRICPPEVKTMNEVIEEILVRDFIDLGMPEEDVKEMVHQTVLNEGMSDKTSLYVMTNSKRMFGANAILFEDQLYSLAEKLDSDLYIMPSSIHEVIAVSTDIGNPEELAAMVSEINASEVALEDRLSNQVYHYDKNLRTVSLATDTPNKSLGEDIAKASMSATFDVAR